MAKNLTLDIGNSSAKAMLWIDGAPAGEPLWGSLTAYDIDHLCLQAGGKVDCAAVCTVADSGQELIEAARCAASKMIAVSAATPSPIDLAAYATAATLGADRIAAMAGAVSLHPGCELLVVDCGTAITYDRVDTAGRFLGGNIAPGLGMRLRALHAFTARLPLVETDPDAPLWGQSTAQAMQAGAMRGAMAEVLYYYRQCPAGTRLVLTGGRASDICHDLTNLPLDIDPLLVLRGLNHIIEYNEANLNK